MGIKTHMDYNQGAYDAECAALARALGSAARRQTVPKRVTVFTDAQAVVRRIASEEPGPARCKRSRREGALRRYGRPDRTSSLRSVSAQHTKESKGTRSR
jgi:ribonuclease HI